MSKQELRESAGRVGVIASLVFVVLQVRRTNIIASARTRQALTSEYREFWTAFASDDDFMTMHGSYHPEFVTMFGARQAITAHCHVSADSAFRDTCGAGHLSDNR